MKRIIAFYWNDETKEDLIKPLFKRYALRAVKGAVKLLTLVRSQPALMSLISSGSIMFKGILMKNPHKRCATEGEQENLMEEI